MPTEIYGPPPRSGIARIPCPSCGRPCLVARRPGPWKGQLLIDDGAGWRLVQLTRLHRALFVNDFRCLRCAAEGEAVTTAARD